MRCRCVKYGSGGSGIASLGPRTEVCCDRVTVRCSHCGERADNSLTELMLRGYRTLRLEKPEGSTESTKGSACGRYMSSGEFGWLREEGEEFRSWKGGGEGRVVQTDLH